VNQLTWTSGHSYAPLLLLMPPAPHVVWYDDQPGNFEVYYKQHGRRSHLSANQRLTDFGPSIPGHRRGCLGESPCRPGR
jgi:hypothetical protein